MAFEVFSEAVARFVPIVEHRNQLATSNQPQSVTSTLARLGDPKKHQWSLDEAESMLRYIDPALGYEDWRQVIAATCEWSCGLSEARSLAERWSKGNLYGAPYADFEQDEFDAKWDEAFGKLGQVGNVGFSRVKEFALAGGWVNPRETVKLLLADDGKETFSSKDLDILRSTLAVVMNGGELRFIRREDVERSDLSQLMKRGDAGLLAVRILNEKLGDAKRDGSKLITDLATSRATKMYSRIAFDPTNSDPNALNLWQGLKVSPDSHWLSAPEGFGDLFGRAWSGSPCSQIIQMIYADLCNNDTEKFSFLWKWLAHAVQRPEEKPGTAIVVTGVSGTGKGTLVRIFERFWGTGSKILRTNDVAGNFNGVLSRTFFVIFDEAVFGGDGKTADELKSLITEPVLTITLKYKEPIELKSCHRFVILTNRTHAKKTDRFDRRDFVISPSEERANLLEYWDAVYQQINSDEGISALLSLLMSTDLRGFDFRRPPATREKLDQKLESLKGTDAVIFDWLIDGRKWIEGTELTTQQIISVIHEREGPNYLPNAHTVGQALSAIFPEVEIKRTNQHKYRPRPPLEAARKMFEAYMHQPIPWAELTG